MEAVRCIRLRLLIGLRLLVSWPLCIEVRPVRLWGSFRDTRGEKSLAALGNGGKRLFLMAFKIEGGQ